MEIQNIFTKYLEQKTIFSNKEALSIKWVPEQLLHREEQLNAIASVLAPILKGEKTSNLFVYGKTGTGKTVVCNLVAKELEKTKNTLLINNNEQNNFKIKTIYLNCKMKRAADTEYRLLAALIKELGREVPFTGLPTEQVYHIFFETIEKERQTIILIIDEIDALVEKTGDGVLYNLTRINQELKNSRICIIGITNILGFIDSLDPRVRSSLSEEEIIFPPYNALQLQDILRQRAGLAFVAGALEQGVIEKCAALAAQEHGDARRALDLLRVSAELAERSNSTITIAHIDKAQEKIDIDRVVEIAKSQPKQSQLVLQAILLLDEKNKEIQTGDVFDIYHNLSSSSGLKPLTFRRVSDLIAEFDLFGIINTKIVSRGRYGRTRTISLALTEHVKKKLKNLLY